MEKNKGKVRLPAISDNIILADRFCLITVAGAVIALVLLHLLRFVLAVGFTNSLPRTA